ncbi:hypothetical protein R5R35_007962 [Gryllus longicercus]|uniref:F-box protein n=1 Tax=Gryllus longicercus TaxID=2509291 RepID=A0AAN9V907_9ORTH|nr:Uncharacterized protein GBIM_18507 [Gryllus bimaculatus]
MGLHLSIDRVPGADRMADWRNHGEDEAEREYMESGADVIEYYPSYVESETDGNLELFTRKWCENGPTVGAFADCGNNGRIIGGENVPEEILSLILSHVDSKSLPNCRLVCQRWKNIIDLDIWRFKLEKKVYRQLTNLLHNIRSPFPIIYRVFKHKSFNRNLIKNPSGEEKLCHWEILKNGGDGWKIEEPPNGADELPFDENFPTTSCFSTSYIRCTKVQLIDLWAEGLSPIIMDELRPTIYVSEWYAARYDCASTYTLYVTLLNRNQQKLLAFKQTKRVEQWLGSEWNKVEHEFKNYCEGVRYVKFFHSGCDCQFWKGHYGSKMSRACVRVVL